MTRLSLGTTQTRIAALIGGVAIAGVVIATLNLTGAVGRHDNDQSNQQPMTASSGGHGKKDYVPLGSDAVSKGPGKPCGAAKHVSDLAQVKTETVFWPAKQQFTDAWTCADGSAPFIMYGDVQVSYAPGADDGTDPQALMEGLAKEFKEGSVAQIQGHPSWVGTGDAEAGAYTHAFMLVNDTAVTLLAPADVSLDDVLRVANDLELPAPAKG